MVSAIVYIESDASVSTGDLPVYFKNIGDLPVIAHSLSTFEECNSIDEVIPVVPEDFLLYVSENIVDRFKFGKVRKIRTSRDTRFKTVLSGLEGISADSDLVIIHDALYPLISKEKIAELITETISSDACALGLIADVPVKRAEMGFILASLDRKRICLMQSPQAFKVDLIQQAYSNAGSSKHVFADDAAVVEHLGHKVSVLKGEKDNFRINSDHDLEIARMVYDKFYKG